MVMASAQIVFCLVALLVVDRLGRRILLMSSAGTMGLCSLAMGYFFFLNVSVHPNVNVNGKINLGVLACLLTACLLLQSGDARDRSLDWVPVLVSCVYMMGFSFGLGPVAWLYVGEIFPDRVKGMASSAANASNWLCAFLVTKFFPIVNETQGVHVSFWTFGACCLVGVLAVGLLFPETKGKTLDQIQDELSGRSKSGAHAAHAEKGDKLPDNVPRRKYGSFDDSSDNRH